MWDTWWAGGELRGGMLFQLHPAALQEEKHRPHRLESALWTRPRSLVSRVTVGSPAPHSWLASFALPAFPSLRHRVGTTLPWPFFIPFSLVVSCQKAELETFAVWPRGSLSTSSPMSFKTLTFFFLRCMKVVSHESVSTSGHAHAIS